MYRLRLFRYILLRNGCYHDRMKIGPASMRWGKYGFGRRGYRLWPETYLQTMDSMWQERPLDGLIPVQRNYFRIFPVLPERPKSCRCLVLRQSCISAHRVRYWCLSSFSPRICLGRIMTYRLRLGITEHCSRFCICLLRRIDRFGGCEGLLFRRTIAAKNFCRPIFLLLCMDWVSAPIVSKIEFRGNNLCSICRCSFGTVCARP